MPTQLYVQSEYRSGMHSYAAGQIITVDDDVAEWLIRDSCDSFAIPFVKPNSDPPKVEEPQSESTPDDGEESPDGGDESDEEGEQPKAPPDGPPNDKMARPRKRKGKPGTGRKNRK